VLVSAFAYPGLRDDRLRDATRREHLLAVRNSKRSFWRREVHLFPRRQREVTPVFVEAKDADGATGDHTSEPKVPWYKREVGTKKKKDKQGAAPAAAQPSDDGGEPNVPWYKREIGGKKKAKPVAVEPAAQPADEAEPSVVERIWAATDHASVLPRPDVEATETSEPPEATTPASDPWSAFFGDAVVSAETPAQETVDAEREHEELPAEKPVADAKVPWYKREVGPKKKGEKEKAQVVAEAPQGDVERAPEPKVPWYKREVGPKKKGKKEKTQVVAEAPQGDVERASEPKVPWYKREVGRKKKAQPIDVEAAREELPTDEPTAVARILAATQREAPLHDEAPGSEPTEADPIDETAAASEPTPAAGDTWAAFFGDAVVGAETATSESAPSVPVTPEVAEEPTEEIPVASVEPQQPEVVETATAEPKVPWYKRELGSKKKTAGKKAKQEKKSKRDKQAQPVAKAASSEPKVAWYKREIGRKKSSAPQTQKDKRHSRRSSGRKQRIVGLKVGGSQLAAARIVNNGSAELVQLARMGLPKGVVVGGELRDPEALTTALKKFFRDNKLPRQGVRLGIGSNRIGVRVFDITGVGERTLLDNAVRFKAQEFLPIPLEQAVLDYHVVGESSDEEGRIVYRVLVAFAYRELVDRYLDACRRAGIRLSGIDLEAFALLRALGAPVPADAPPPDAAAIAVAIGHDRSTLAVSDGRICEFTRILEWGGFQLDVAVSRVLGVTPSEAEAVKLEVDLTSSTRLVGDLSPERSKEVLDAVRRQVELLARELVSSLQFYQSQPGSLGVGEIVITGGTAQLPGLAEELQRLIGVKVRVGDPYARVKVGRRVKADAQLPSLAVAIGLGIED
jgi:type IV pilus assembly protein PilM